MTKKMEIEEFKTLVNKVQSDDPSENDIELLREQLPLFTDFIKIHGNLANQAGDQLIESMPSNSFAREFFRAGWKDFGEQLGLADSPPLEQSLIHLAALCWLRQ